MTTASAVRAASALYCIVSCTHAFHSPLEIRGLQSRTICHGTIPLGSWPHSSVQGTKLAAVQPSNDAVSPIGYGQSTGDEQVVLARAHRNTIRRVCTAGNVDKALDLLSDREQTLRGARRLSAAALELEMDAYVIVMQALAKQSTGRSPKTAQNVQDLLKRMKQMLGCRPTRPAYNAAIVAWSKSYKSWSGTKCEGLLRELWAHYDATQHDDYLPSAATYISTLTAYARSRMGKAGAEKAESLLEEMESLYKDGYASLGPNTMAVNIVL